MSTRAEAVAILNWLRQKLPPEVFQELRDIITASKPPKRPGRPKDDDSLALRQAADLLISGEAENPNQAAGMLAAQAPEHQRKALAQRIRKKLGEQSESLLPEAEMRAKMQAAQASSDPAEIRRLKTAYLEAIAPTIKQDPHSAFARSVLDDFASPDDVVLDLLTRPDPGSVLVEATELPSRREEILAKAFEEHVETWDL